MLSWKLRGPPRPPSETPPHPPPEVQPLRPAPSRGDPRQKPLCRGSPRSAGLSLRAGGAGQKAQPEGGRGWGGGDPRPSQPPSAPTLAPAAAGSTTDLIRQLQQPAGARRPPRGAPHLREGRGWGEVTAPGSHPLPAGGGGRPFPPTRTPLPGPNYNPSHVPPRAPKSRTRILEHLEGEGRGPRGWEEKGRRAWAPAPRKSFSYLGGSPSAPASGAPAPARGQDSASCRCLLN